MEGHHYRKTGELVDLSPQNLIDCTRNYSNLGCTGGYVDEAFEYIRQNPGIDTEAGYPFEEAEGECRFDPDYIGANVTGDLHRKLNMNSQKLAELKCSELDFVSLRYSRVKSLP